MPTVSVKWKDLVYQEVEIDSTKPLSVFKYQLYGLTGVPPERLTIWLKGVALQDDCDWSKLRVKEGQKLLMTSAEDLPVRHSVGLCNLGNTCYMNSTMQCLYSVAELKSALTEYPQTGKNDLDEDSHLLTLATRDLFNELDSSDMAVRPQHFWEALSRKYPRFREQQNESLMQQDAEELWTHILDTLSESLTSSSSSVNIDVVKQNFGIDLITRVRDEGTSNTHSVNFLKCYISDDVDHMLEGLKLDLTSVLEKASGESVHSDSRINSLPNYLTVHFLRYKWVKESNEKVKLLKKVEYPMELDIFDLCTDELCKTLKTLRQLPRDNDGRKAGSSKDICVEPLSGLYDLVAILTHKGIGADSGHYVAWIKQEDGTWIQCDDDNLIPRREEEITNLSGGGDYHMAYICMYKAREVISVGTLELPRSLTNEIEPAAEELTLVGNPIKPLKRYQLDGVKWLWYRHCKGEGGGILADEMGLGKTLQTCVFVVSLFVSRLVKRVLVVVPAILVGTWSDELQELGMLSYIFHGPEKDKELGCLIEDNGILITSYETLVYHKDSDSLRSLKWDYLIVDEGHYIKNLVTARSLCIRKIRAKHRLLLTGTPIEKSINEVWSALNFCMPKLFNDHEHFKKTRSEPIECKKMSIDKGTELNAIKDVRTDLQPHMLRRLAANVLILPPKHDFVVWLKLSRLQRNLYKSFLRRSESAIYAACFAATDICKKLCDDPHLIQMADEPKVDADLKYTKDGNSRLLLSNIKRIMKEYDDKSYQPCKLLFIESYVPEMCKNGHHVLIFAQRKYMLDKIEEMLKPLQCGRLEGRCSLKDRKNTIKEFQAGILSVLLIQSKVGSVGLTLTKADRVIVVDPSWNPSTDNQSICRAYRQGQKKQVVVYRLITSGTVEEDIYRKQIYKTRLAKLAMDTDNPYAYFAGEEKRTMFREGNFYRSETEMKLNKLHDIKQITDLLVQSEINALKKLPQTTGVSYHSLLFTKVASPDRDQCIVSNPKKVVTYRNIALQNLSKRQTMKGAERGLQKPAKVPSQSRAREAKCAFSSGGDHWGRPSSHFSSPLHKTYPPKQRARQRASSPFGSFGLASKNILAGCSQKTPTPSGKCMPFQEYVGIKAPIYEKFKEVDWMDWSSRVFAEKKKTLELLKELQRTSDHLAREEVLLKMKNYLQILGSRIDQVIDRVVDLNKRERMATQLWNYVATFSNVSGAKLQHAYSKLKQEKGTAAGVGPSQT